jgi:hypothetical protein
MLDFIIKYITMSLSRLWINLADLELFSQVGYFLCAALIIVIISLLILGVNGIVYKLLLLGVLSLLVVFTWLAFSGEFLYAYIGYIVAFTGAVLMLFLSIILMLPISNRVIMLCLCHLMRSPSITANGVTEDHELLRGFPGGCKTDFVLDRLRSVLADTSRFTAIPGHFGYVWDPSGGYREYVQRAVILKDHLRQVDKNASYGSLVVTENNFFTTSVFTLGKGVKCGCNSFGFDAPFDFYIQNLSIVDDYKGQPVTVYEGSNILQWGDVWLNALIADGKATIVTLEVHGFETLQHDEIIAHTGGEEVMDRMPQGLY